MSHITTARAEKPVTNWSEKVKITYYDETGSEYYKEPKLNETQNRICAKLILSGNEEQYMVWARSGRLYKVDLDPKEKRKDGWRFITMTKLGFYNYLKYLQTHNDSSYIIASREV